MTISFYNNFKSKLNIIKPKIYLLGIGLKNLINDTFYKLQYYGQLIYIIFLPFSFLVFVILKLGLDNINKEKQ